MKINPEKIQGLQNEQSQKQRVNQKDDTFGKLLSGELEKSGKPAQSASLPKSPVSGLLPGQILAMQESTQVGAAGARGSQLMDQLDGVMNNWDKYTVDLKSENTSLREADGTLKEIENDLASLREKWPNLSTESPEMGSIVDEVEILAATERFKMNRGDYM